MIPTEQQRETAMTNTIPNDTRELEIGELDRVSGGFIKGALEGVCSKGEGTGGGPMGMISQIMQQAQVMQQQQGQG
jgi:hypothetical protein